MPKRGETSDVTLSNSSLTRQSRRRRNGVALLRQGPEPREHGREPEAAAASGASAAGVPGVPWSAPTSAVPPTASCFPALSSGPFLKFASQLPLGPSAAPVPSELCGVRATHSLTRHGQRCSRSRHQLRLPTATRRKPGGPGPLSHSTSRLGPPGAYYGSVTLESGCHLWSNQSVVIRSSFQGRPVHWQ